MSSLRRIGVVAFLSLLLLDASMLGTGVGRDRAWGARR